MSAKALFLDRDGVVNIDYGYVYKTEDFQFLTGIFELAREAISKDYLIFIITNQAGIARGFYGISDFNILSEWMCQKFKSEGVLISKVFFSPYHPIHGIGEYKKDDISRKPNPGMIHQAAEEFNINLNSSILIGDKVSDIKAGLNAGIQTNIYLQASGLPVMHDLDCHYVSALRDAVPFL
ncbi:HAD family hydrolase [Gammaproteobacteria bacterium]|nr:HAD family hydrolase [Gammaproteobacteria bacterium]